LRDYGGYGIRTGRFGKAYVANGQRGVRLKLTDGTTLVLGSQKSDELVRILSSSHASTSRRESVP
jgi:hypothetical protein